LVSHGAVVEASTDTLFTGLEHLGMMGEDVFGQSEEFPSCFDFASLKIPQQKSLAGNAIDAQVLGTFHLLRVLRDGGLRRSPQCLI
jgi:hypothetical protein